MSDTTNPTPADGHKPMSANPPTNPYVGAVDSAAIRRGHEADSYDFKSVLSVPLLVILFFVLAFTTVTIVFAFVSHTEVDPNANPFAVKQNEAPLNDRIGRIQRGGTVDQPRLEPLRERTGDEQAISRPETPTGNSPEIHPEDIRPNRENTPELYKVGWIEADKSVARITIDDAMRLALIQFKLSDQALVALRKEKVPESVLAKLNQITNKEFSKEGFVAGLHRLLTPDEAKQYHDIILNHARLNGLFPTDKKGTEPPKSSNVPSAANAGRGSGASIALPPKLPVVVEEKK